MIFSIINEAAEKGELFLVENGFCRFHKRRDGIVVIREIVVLPDYRRQGIASKLVDRVRKKYSNRVIIAKCPLQYESNKFWEEYGFICISRSKLNVWEFRS